MSNAEFNFASWRPLATSSDRRRAVIVAASAVLHAAVLAPLAMGLFAERAPLPDIAPPMVFVEMEPRPLLGGEIARAPTPSSVAAREQAPALGGVVEALPARDEEDRPTAPNPRIGVAPAPGAPAAPADAWQITPEGTAAAVGRSMRTGAGGCRIMDGRLSPAEQALCDERFNAAAGAAGPLGPRTLTPSEQRRDAQFARDGAAALAGYEARRRRLSGGVGIIGPGDCPGSNLGAGCAGAHLDPAIRQGATTVANPGLGSNDAGPMRPIRGQE